MGQYPQALWKIRNCPTVLREIPEVGSSHFCDFHGSVANSLSVPVAPEYFLLPVVAPGCFGASGGRVQEESAGMPSANPDLPYRRCRCLDIQKFFPDPVWRQIRSSPRYHGRSDQYAWGKLCCWLTLMISPVLSRSPARYSFAHSSFSYSPNGR